MQLYFRWISFKWHIAGIKKKIQLKIDLLAGDFSYRTDTSTVMAVILRFISSVFFLHILFTFDFSLYYVLMLFLFLLFPPIYCMD